LRFQEKLREGQGMTVRVVTRAIDSLERGAKSEEISYRLDGVDHVTNETVAPGTKNWSLNCERVSREERGRQNR